jgi:hypothetical protein
VAFVLRDVLMRIWVVDGGLQEVIRCVVVREKARQMMTTCQNLILSPGMGGDPRGPRANRRSQTGIKSDMAQFFLTSPENACYVHGRWSPFTLPPKFPVRPHDYRGPRTRAQRYA